jgi:hypothetical protein
MEFGVLYFLFYSLKLGIYSLGLQNSTLRVFAGLRFRV